MSTAAFPISADQAERDLATATKRLNAGRFIPAVPRQIQELAAATTVHVYNVSPFQFLRELGTAGSYRIPACVEGEKYSAMRPIPGVFWEPVIADETKFENRFEDGDEKDGGSSGGLYIAQQVIGTGRMLTPSESFVKWGVFIGSARGPGAKPTEKELAEANKMLGQTADAMVREADAADRKGPDELKATLTDKHHWAAAFRKLDPKEHRWMREGVATVSGRQTCPVDGTTVDGNVVMCPTCRYIFDEAKYEKLKAKIAK